jgi:hypothetical protein
MMEERRMMDADPIKIGAVYIEQDSGSDLHGDTFEIQFEGGQSGSELTRLVIDTDQGPAGRSVGDLIFDTVKGGWGADEAFALQIVSKNGIEDVKWHVEDGGTRLVFDFKGFHAGDKLVFSIDVDEIQDYDPSITNQDLINEGVDPIRSWSSSRVRRSPARSRNSTTRAPQRLANSATCTTTCSRGAICSSRPPIPMACRRTII